MEFISKSKLQGDKDKEEKPAADAPKNAGASGNKKPKAKFVPKDYKYKDFERNGQVRSISR